MHAQERQWLYTTATHLHLCGRGSGIHVLRKDTPHLPCWRSNSQPVDHKSNRLTTELSRPHYLNKRAYNAPVAKLLFMIIIIIIVI